MSLHVCKPLSEPLGKSDTEYVANPEGWLLDRSSAATTVRCCNIWYAQKTTKSKTSYKMRPPPVERPRLLYGTMRRGQSPESLLARDLAPSAVGDLVGDAPGLSGEPYTA